MSPQDPASSPACADEAPSGLVSGGRRSVLCSAAASAVGALLMLPRPASAQALPGVSATEIRIGNTTSLSGPVSALGTIARAQAAYFKMVNDQGGVAGRKITFLFYDDGFNPAKTAEMARKLIEQDEVALLFGNLGTGPNSAIVKYVNQLGVPFGVIGAAVDRAEDGPLDREARGIERVPRRGGAGERCCELARLVDAPGLAIRTQEPDGEGGIEPRATGEHLLGPGDEELGFVGRGEPIEQLRDGVHRHGVHTRCRGEAFSLNRRWRRALPDGRRRCALPDGRRRCALPHRRRRSARPHRRRRRLASRRRNRRPGRGGNCGQEGATRHGGIIAS